METTANKTTATLLQLSAYTQYFFPFGNFIFPVLIWSAKKDQSEFVDYNGKQAINFQLSLLVYSIVLTIIAVPIFLYTFFRDFNFTMENHNNWVFENNARWIIQGFENGKVSGLIVTGIVAALVILVLKLAEFFFIFYAAVKNSKGEKCNFPLTIKFIK